MIEMPEAATIARQMHTTLTGKTVQRFTLGSLRHKFLWLNKPAEEYDTIMAGKQVTGAESYGRSIYLYMGEKDVQWFGELGGRILYHAPGEELPGKYHLRWDFSDASAMTFNMQMWGFVGLLEKSELATHPYAEVGIPPLSEAFSFERFDMLLEEYPDKGKKGVEGFLVTSRHINGIGNGYLQDILFRAKLHPTRKIPAITTDERHQLYDAIRVTISQAIELGGRDEERDLFNHPGGYQRVLSSQMNGKPCPVCGTSIQKITYLGGACYLCPTCQV